MCFGNVFLGASLCPSGRRLLLLPSDFGLLVQFKMVGN